MKTPAPIKIAAAIALFTALWTIIPDWQTHWGFLRAPRQLAASFGATLFMSWLVHELVLLSHGIGAIALFRRRRWAWNLLLGALLIQILLTLFTAIRFSFFPPPPPPPIDGDEVVRQISLWPGYIRAVLNMLAVTLLLSPQARSRIE